MNLISNKILPCLALRTLTLGVLGLAAQTVCSADLHIALRAEPTVSPGKQLTIGDVARLTGSSAPFRAQVAALDLNDPIAAGSAKRLTRKQIEMRILLAGINRSDFRLTGPESVQARCVSNLAVPSKIESLLAAEISRQFGLSHKQVSVRLEKNSELDSVAAELAGQDFSLTTFLSSQMPLGRSTIRTEFQLADRHRLSRNLDAYVIVSKPVVLATQAIPTGTKITPSMLRVVTRPLDKHQNTLEAEQVIGQVARRHIGSNEILLANYVAAPRANNRPLVNRGTLIDVIISIGRSEVRLKNAQVMSSGQVGDKIVVKNTRSGKQLTAIIVDQNTARVTALTGGPM